MDGDRIGDRIKARRHELGLTLKALESRAGVSATHVSEIERGRTSPTVGALSKISGALEKDIRYFLESERLDDFCVRRSVARPIHQPFAGARMERLAGGVPGGSLSVQRLVLSAGARSPQLCLAASAILWSRRGRLEVELPGEQSLLEEGDSLHIGRNCSFHFGSADADGAELWLLTGVRRLFA